MYKNRRHTAHSKPSQDSQQTSGTTHDARSGDPSNPRDPTCIYRAVVDFASLHDIQVVGNPRSVVGNLIEDATIGVAGSDVASQRSTDQGSLKNTRTPSLVRGTESPASSISIAFPDQPLITRHDLHGFSDEEFSYLAAKGCFNLPPPAVVDDLLQCYFDFVHPHIPCLDEEEFWERRQLQKFEVVGLGGQENRGAGISLLVLQAVLFAATNCAALSVLLRAGYSSRKAAQLDFFSKVRALYSLDVEKDQIAVLQSLLLMSYWRHPSWENKDAWHWSGLATSLAFSLGLHKKPGADVSERQKTMRKRCWWSCLLRDRLVALAVQQNPRIRLEESDVPMLTLADYNVGFRLTSSDLSPEEELGKRTVLSMFSIQLVRLAACGIGGDQPDPKNSSCLAPPASETWARVSQDRRVTSYETGSIELDSWSLNLPKVLQYDQDGGTDDGVLPCILVHRISLHIYYQ
ncbi:hypothetical protein GQ53DRAFT_823137 [Thozetella sp. PMI_491]|nr:hypothetical protein GQ53DRAFT_823137 [Thozetella sp. PMI_491]